MNGTAFTLGEEIELRKVEYKLHGELWKKYQLERFNFNNWEKIKYLNSDCSSFNDDVDKIPRDKGGLYLFYVKCEIISGITEFPLYIGRAQITKGQNLNKRVKEYFQHYNKDNERPKITRMLKYWGSELYLAYMTIEKNDEIKDLEKELINTLLLPMNTEIPDTEVKEAIKAFQ